MAAEGKGISIVEQMDIRFKKTQDYLQRIVIWKGKELENVNYFLRMVNKLVVFVGKYFRIEMNTGKPI